MLTPRVQLTASDRNEWLTLIYWGLGEKFIKSK